MQRLRVTGVDLTTGKKWYQGGFSAWFISWKPSRPIGPLAFAARLNEQAPTV